MIIIIVLSIFCILGWGITAYLLYDKKDLENKIEKKYKDKIRRKSTLISDQHEKILYFKKIIKKLEK